MFTKPWCVNICMVVCLFATTATVRAQDSAADDANFLAQRILSAVPDIPNTRPTFGTGSDRMSHALEHAQAIISAASAEAPRWDALAASVGWSVFNAERDLPGLITAIAYNESMFRNVVRLNDGSRVYELAYETRHSDGRRFRRIVTSDIGIMQVRAPSRTAAACGVESSSDTERLLSDVAFNYRVGACVLTNVMISAATSYHEDSSRRRLRSGMRPTSMLTFFGVYGPRRDTLEAARATELIAIERYNWGGNDLYLRGSHATYALRILRTMERFVPPFSEAELSGG